MIRLVGLALLLSSVLTTPLCVVSSIQPPDEPESLLSLLRSAIVLDPKDDLEFYSREELAREKGFNTITEKVGNLRRMKVADDVLLFPDPLLKSRGLQSSSSKHVNIWQKLKESLGTTIVGIILICAMPFAIWINEGRHLKQLKRVDFCKKNATSVDCNAVTDETVGKLVHFRGPVSVDGGALNSGDKFNVEVDGAVVLKRTMFIYQRIEQAEQKTEQDRIGGGETRTTIYTAREDWTMQPQPKQLEHVPDATNDHGIWDSLSSAASGSMPSNMPSIVVSSYVHVGEFGLSEEIIKNHPFEFCAEWAPVPAELLPESVEGCDGLEKGNDNVLRTFDQGEGPKNGDCKVVFEYVKEGFSCSFIAKQMRGMQSSASAGQEEPLLPQSEHKYGVERCVVVDSGCCKYKEGDLGDIWVVQRGYNDLESMIVTENQKEEQLQKILRIVSWLLLCAGWVMLFSPFLTALQVLPILSKLGYFAVVLVALIVSLVCCVTVMALAYVRYRPLLGIGILALAGAIWGIVIWRLDYAAKNGGS